MEAYLIFQSCAPSLSSDIWCNHTEAYRCHPTSNIRHRTSEIRHPTFDIRDPIFDIRHPTSDIRHPTSDIPHLTSEIWHPRFDIRHPTSEIRHPTSDIRHPRSGIRHPTSDIRDLISDIRHPRSDIRDPRFDVRHLKGWPWCVGPGIKGPTKWGLKGNNVDYSVFFKYFLSFCIVQNAYYPGMLFHWETCSEVVSSSGLYDEFEPFALAHLILGL